MAKSAHIEIGLQKISESVYVGLCHKIGTPQQVAIRRDVVDVTELLENEMNGDAFAMESGSRREGYRLEGTDIDVMFLLKNHQVFWDLSQAQHYNTDTKALILCDASDSPPGFTLLWLPLERARSDVISACVRINGAVYISSAKVREITPTVSPDFTVHGPCMSGRVGTWEYDFAFCFATDFWPPLASSWIDRCHSWPPRCLLNDIIKSGCHFVAIGHKRGHNVDNEWRISFSQAEHKLVYSMNHTQFLTYGLLKLFLKEIINKGLGEGEKVLCSYHLKTAIFWIIQKKAMSDWSPKSLLAGFWVCFKLLLKWVYDGICPNFFIPENNMFLSDRFQDVQANLFSQLYGFYENGVTFLLQSPTIRSCFFSVLCNPRLSISTEEHTMLTEIELDVEVVREVVLNDSYSLSNISRCMKYLYNIEHLIMSTLKECQVIKLQTGTAIILQSSAFMLHSMHIRTLSTNRQKYTADKMCLNMLKLAAKFGFVSDRLYIVMYLYKTLRYKEALSAIETIMADLTQPWIMYRHVLNPEKYIEEFRGQSWSMKIRRALARDLQLYSDKMCVTELIPEWQCSGSLIEVPPLVFLHMLEFLCCRHVDSVKTQVALDSPQILVHRDRGVFVVPFLRDISWEILGICQQISGNLHAALYSYGQSLRQIPEHKIQSATKLRIQDLHLSRYH